VDKQVKQYLLIGSTIAVLGLGTYAFVKIRKKRLVAKDIKSIKSSSIPSLGINTYTIAKQIGLDLGTAYPVYDPRSWTENDEAVLRAVLKVPKTLISKLVSDYKSIYKRSLPNDLQSKLDDWKEVEYLFN